MKQKQPRYTVDYTIEKPAFYVRLHEGLGEWGMTPVLESEKRWIRETLEGMRACKEEGFEDHTFCGICPEHAKPRYKCGCELAFTKTAQEVILALRGERDD